ncbi:MAG TPA: hypothetical protein VNA69_19515 [Thermoanaerobaculia bacterium]|nr:hypothetical protein [Thermoanaerobaculia bacterium]
MPKFKDLGISVIPATMRPPEIGDGGGGPDDDVTITECIGDNTCIPGEAVQTACHEGTCRDKDKDDDVQTACHEGTCEDKDKDDDAQTACAEGTCAKDKQDKQDVSAFTPDSIAQLRQQLELQIGS